MPGMNSGLNVSDPTLVAAFRAALLHQGLLALLIFAVLALGWVSVREWVAMRARAARAAASGVAASAVAASGAAASAAATVSGSGADRTSTPAADQPAAPAPAASALAAIAEPAWRQALRIGFALLWILDGILQAQPKMAAGLPSQVIEPIAATSPPWVQHLVNWAGTSWSYHPIEAGASAVWIQVGIGIWMLVAVRGGWSRLAGLVSAGWGLVVWVFGESFGGIFAPGLTWLFGAPGAAAWYAVAGVLIALPERAWFSRRLGQLATAGLGLFLVGMAVLQAWPGRGFWQGTVGGQPGSLTSMVQSMSGAPQPRFLASWVSAFGDFTAAHGFAVNLFVVVALAAIGGAFLSLRPRVVRLALIPLAVICLADWVLIEDLGFLGGLGTDPNSMVPFLLLAVGGYLALARRPAAVAAAAPARPRLAPAAAVSTAIGQIRGAAAPSALATASFRSVVSLGAVALIVLGAAPMAAAQSSPMASTILAQAIDGSSVPLNFPAADFSLVNQDGKAVTMASLRGKVVIMTLLDPVCTSECPFIADEFRIAAQTMAAQSSQVEFIAINYNPLYLQTSYVKAFTNMTHLDGVRNWQFLTGSLPELQKVWKVYGAPLEVLPAGAMVAHGEYAYAIDRSGTVRLEMDFGAGPATAATESSFAAELVNAAQQALKRP